MVINVTLGEAKPQKEKPFPKLMISSKSDTTKSRIVFFSDYQKGICIVEGGVGTSYVGEFLESWNMDVFTDYNEPITIQNA